MVSAEGRLVIPTCHRSSSPIAAGVEFLESVPDSASVMVAQEQSKDEDTNCYLQYCYAVCLIDISIRYLRQD
ncbi:MAG: hypothetical protein RI591_06375 [Dehalococcoidia bacterium]|nr:hypothetical protein [Dehalococcoidia bacterium]